MKIVIIEDDKVMVDYVSNVVRLGWTDAQICSSHLGENGIFLVHTENPDAVILDIGLPDISGFDVLKQIRLTSEVPVLILSARTSEFDVVEGLNLGANDYVIKPFRHLEFLARLKSLLKTQKVDLEDLSITYGPFHFGRTICDLVYKNKEIKLTNAEGQIMNKLMLSRGSAVVNENIARVIWGNDNTVGIEGVKVYIYRLRQKLEDDPKNPKLIINKPGVGYYLIPGT